MTDIHDRVRKFEVKEKDNKIYVNVEAGHRNTNIPSTKVALDNNKIKKILVKKWGYIKDDLTTLKSDEINNIASDSLQDLEGEWIFQLPEEIFNKELVLELKCCVDEYISKKIESDKQKIKLKFSKDVLMAEKIIKDLDRDKSFAYTDLLDQGKIDAQKISDYLTSKGCRTLRDHRHGYKGRYYKSSIEKLLTLADEHTQQLKNKKNTKPKKTANKKATTSKIKKVDVKATTSPTTAPKDKKRSPQKSTHNKKD